MEFVNHLDGTDDLLGFPGLFQKRQRLLMFSAPVVQGGIDPDVGVDKGDRFTVHGVRPADRGGSFPLSGVFEMPWEASLSLSTDFPGLR